MARLRHVKILLYLKNHGKNLFHINFFILKKIISIDNSFKSITKSQNNISRKSLITSSLVIEPCFKIICSMLVFSAVSPFWNGQTS